MAERKVNELLMLKLRTEIIMPLNDLVEWDRYGVREDGSGFIYGWIKRDGDEFYDFVSFNFRMYLNEFVFDMNTSSKKYTNEITRRVCKNGQNRVLEDHIDCQSVSDIPEANLVKWQKTYGVLFVLFILSLLFTRVFGTAILNIVSDQTGSGTPSHIKKLRNGTILEDIEMAFWGPQPYQLSGSSAMKL